MYGRIKILAVFITGIMTASIIPLNAAASTDIIVTSLGDAVDNTQLSWSTGGYANWFRETNTYYYGGDAAQSGAIGSNQYTWIKTSVNGAGTLEFYWKVSCASQNYLAFYIDGTEYDRISGATGWQEETYSISSGYHELMWKYVKGSDNNNNNDNNAVLASDATLGDSSTASTTSSGGSVTIYQDCGWLDYVRWTPATNHAPNQPAKPSGETNGKTGVTYTYSTYSTDPDGDRIKYCFDWGDGSSSWTGYYNSGATAYASHSWSNAGTYYVKVKARDENGAESSWSSSLAVSIVVNSPPTASFTYTPTNPSTEDTIYFHDESSDSDGNIVSWHWDFGDGSTSNQQNPSHQYSEAGTYSVTLTVTDNDGAKDSVTKNIEVKKPVETIKVAILADFIKYNNIPFAATQIKYILEKEGKWETQDKIYQFSCRILNYTQVILWLNNNNYKAFIIPGIGAGYRAGFLKNLSFFKSKVQQFVSNGGGYFGICGGAVMASSGINNPDTPMEWLMNRAALELIPSKVIQDFAYPVTASLDNRPEAVGQSAYMWYNESNNTYNESYAFGVTVTLNNIDTNNPLFKNVDTTNKNVSRSFDGNTLRIRWWGGPGFIANKIADYSQEISQMNNAKLHVWKYIGKNASELGLPENVIQNYSHPTYQDLLDYAKWLGNLLYPNRWEDYRKINNTYITTHLQGTGAIAYATYGNGKVLALGPHPEDSIWDGGYIAESNDTGHNSLYKGLYKWKDYSNIDKYADHWLIIRGVALVAGVPENELPYTKIQQNHPPNAPNSPNPKNGATGISIDVTLSWQCSDPDGDTLTYDIYFGTSSNPPLVASGITSTSYTPGTLSYSTTYYWRVVAKDEYGAITSSETWHFTTEAAPSPPPSPKPSPPGGDVPIAA